MAANDASAVESWRLLRALHSNACPVELSAQFEAFRALIEVGLLPAPERHATSGVSTSDSDDALNKDITFNELCSSMKRLKRGKSPGMDGVLPDMSKDGGEIVIVSQT